MPAPSKSRRAANSSIAGPGDCRDLGIGSIPADRYSYGLATSLPIADNFAIGQVHTGRYGTWVRVDRKTMRTAAQAAIRDFDVQGVRRLRQKAGLLSGGNAQKLVIAREFSRNPTVIVAHSPSRGLDVRATAAVHARLWEREPPGQRSFSSATISTKFSPWPIASAS